MLFVSGKFGRLSISDEELDALVAYTIDNMQDKGHQEVFTELVATLTPRNVSRAVLSWLKSNCNKDASNLLSKQTMWSSNMFRVPAFVASYSVTAYVYKVRLWSCSILD